MNECFGKKFILNGEMQPAELFDNSLVYDGDSVYEVIRMAKGTPVFFNDHMDRLSSSVKLQGKEMLAGTDAVKHSVIELSRSDRKKDMNLKIVFNYNNGLGNFLIYFIEPMYPSAEQYKNGVKGILYHAERKIPESKLINHRLRSAIYHKLILEGAYEALLVNENNLITEGSRSNVFFVKGNTLVTAPDNMILSGITRKYILDICAREKIRVEFSSVRVEEISSYESVFMTGTSPMVLPFCCIESRLFNAGLPMMTRLRELYMLEAEESIRTFRMQ
jgi:branched-chain amino acid aminotransferase